MVSSALVHEYNEMVATAGNDINKELGKFLDVWAAQEQQLVIAIARVEQLKCTVEKVLSGLLECDRKEDLPVEQLIENSAQPGLDDDGSETTKVVHKFHDCGSCSSLKMLENEVEVLQAELAAGQDKMDEMQALVEQAGRMCKIRETEIKALHAEFAVVKDHNTILKENLEVAQSESATLECELNEAKTNLANACSLCVETRGAYMSKMDELQSLRTRNRELSLEVEDCNTLRISLQESKLQRGMLEQDLKACEMELKELKNAETRSAESENAKDKQIGHLTAGLSQALEKLAAFQQGVSTEMVQKDSVTFERRCKRDLANMSHSCPPTPTNFFSASNLMESCIDSRQPRPHSSGKRSETSESLSGSADESAVMKTMELCAGCLVLKAEIKKKELSLQAAEATIMELRNDCQSLRQALVEAETEATQSSFAAQEVAVKVKILSEQLKDCDTRAMRTLGTQANGALLSPGCEHSCTVQELSERILVLEAEVSDLSGSLGEARRQYDLAWKEVRTRKEQLEAAEDKLHEMQGLLNDVEQAVDAARESQGAAERVAAERQEELCETRRRVCELEKEMCEICSQCSILRSEVDTKDILIRDLVSKTKSSKNPDNREAPKDCEAQATSQKKVISDLEAQLSTSQRIISDQQEQIRGLSMAHFDHCDINSLMTSGQSQYQLPGQAPDPFTTKKPLSQVERVVCLWKSACQARQKRIETLEEQMATAYHDLKEADGNNKNLRECLEESKAQFSVLENECRATVDALTTQIEAKDCRLMQSESAVGLATEDLDAFWMCWKMTDRELASTKGELRDVSKRLSSCVEETGMVKAELIEAVAKAQRLQEELSCSEHEASTANRELKRLELVGMSAADSLAQSWNTLQESCAIESSGAGLADVTTSHIDRIAMLSEELARGIQNIPKICHDLRVQLDDAQTGAKMKDKIIGQLKEKLQLGEQDATL